LIVLSNLRLLTRYKIWVAGALALLLLLPHIWWQIASDFPSFKYHLNERSSSFRWTYFWEYIPNQLVVFNPLAFVAVVYILVKYKASNVFERGLYFLTIGFIAFFWITSFRGHVEPHWTVACAIPMILLIYKNSLHNPKLMRFVKRWIAPTIILVLIARVLLIIDVLPRRLDFHGKKERCMAIQTVAGQRPVVFTGSFQKPSEYRFFTKQKASVLSSIHSRQTQFDIWQKELNWQEKPVFICARVEGKSKKYEVGGYVFEGFTTENFQSVNRLKIEYTLSRQEVRAGDTLMIAFKIYNPTASDIDFHHSEFPVTFKAAYLYCACTLRSTSVRSTRYATKTINLCDGELNEDLDVLKTGETLYRIFKTVVPALPAGEYWFALTLDNTVCAAKNSNYVPVRIVNNQ